MPLNCSDPLFCYLLIQKWESQTHFICTQRWELPPCSVILDKALLNCPGQKQFVWRTHSPYNDTCFLRDIFCKYLSITLLSAAVFNWWRSSTLTHTGKSGTQESKPCLFLPLLRDFLCGRPRVHSSSPPLPFVPSQLGLHPQESPELHRHTFRNPNSLKYASKCLKKTNLVRDDVMPKARCVWKSLLVSQAFYYMPREELKASL